MTGTPLAVWFTSPSTTTSHATCTPRSPLNGTSWVSISHNTWKCTTKCCHFMKPFNSTLKQLSLIYNYSLAHHSIWKSVTSLRYWHTLDHLQNKKSVTMWTKHQTICRPLEKYLPGTVFSYPLFCSITCIHWEVKSFLQFQCNRISTWLIVYKCSRKAATYSMVFTCKERVNCTSNGINVSMNISAILIGWFT